MDPTCHMATGFGEDVDFVQIEEDVEAIDIEVESQEPVKRRSKTTKRLLVKRKPLSKRSKAWDHFDEGKDVAGNRIAKCKYCDIIYQAKPSVNGTKNLNRHYKTCIKNPNNKDRETQQKLVLEPIGEKGEIKLTNWTFNQNDVRQALSYMIILDELPFRFVEKPGFSHKGDSIADAIEKCLGEWGLLSKLFTITVDNASSNDVACSLIRANMQRRGDCVADGRYTHMRCIAHIVNLIVCDGLKIYESSVNCVRAVVKFIRQSPSRLKRFNECVESESIESKASLCLDVCTRWNSTYIMLNTAQKFESAFGKYARKDPHFMIELQGEVEGIPNAIDWERVRYISVFLEGFYDLTRRISGSLYVTANSLFFDIVSIYDMISKLDSGSDKTFSDMASEMKTKCDKYWGNINKMNTLIYISAILDPRVKLVGIQIALSDMYGDVKGEFMTDKVKREL
ncbi:zinc finger BED domain-containing protein RICESLEEPER 2-like [Silene latifolia]|uniref:zinc finger BED domain-containing protein RICESLEEPER 2-like n=1 Tax=Silene latifolia TaxID=37657 RepID=UPI003D772133